MLYIASDHKGFFYKQRLCQWFRGRNVSYKDLGPFVFEKSDDYPDYAAAVSHAVARSPQHRGVLLCGSGVGMSVAANKFPGIRAALCTSTKMAQLARQDDDSNVLVMGSDLSSYRQAQRIIQSWLDTPFSHLARHKRRIRKIHNIEKTCLS